MPRTLLLAALDAAVSDGAARLIMALGRGCFEVLLFAGIVWIACRLMPRIPARVRFWMWWLCAVKGLITVGAHISEVAVPLPVALPALTAPHLLPAIAGRETPQVAPVIDTPEVPSPDPLSGEEMTAEVARPAAVTPSAPSPVSVPPIFWVVLAYMVGLSVTLSLTMVQMFRAGELCRRASRFADAGTVAIARDAAAACGLRICPPVLLSDRTRSPVVVGIWRPVLVLPTDFSQTVSRNGLRLALTHELAHVRRGDLLLALVPTTFRIVLFFFPPVYLICREAEQAREEACDAFALAASPASGAEYGRLLLTVSHQAGGGARYGASGMAMAQVPFRHLKRRLVAVQTARCSVPAWVRIVAAGLVGILGVLALPWGGLERSAEAAPLTSPLDTLAETPLPRYEVVSLGDLGNGYSGNYSDAWDISDTGQIVGAASLRDGGGRGHGFVLTGGKGNAVDPSLGSEFGRSQAVGVSDGGLVVASAFNRWSRPRAFVWDGQRRYIGTTRGYRYSEAAGVNEAGQVAATATRGRTINGAMPSRAFVWKDGRVRMLATLGGPFSRAHAISADGWVVGKADLARSAGELGVTHACLWDADGQVRDIGTLPGGYNSAARSVSDDGTVVGFSEVEGGAVRAFRAAANNTTQLRDLGTVSGYAHSAAWDVAETATGEVIVGTVMAGRDEGGDSRAVLWQADGRGVDLNQCISPASGWTLDVARAINKRGEIVGQGMIGGRRQAFLLRPLAGS